MKPMSYGGAIPPESDATPRRWELHMQSETTGTAPFSPFEWMLSMRYLRSRRREGFISFIAAISFLSLMIGVAALIIVFGRRALRRADGMIEDARQEAEAIGLGDAA